MLVKLSKIEILQRSFKEEREKVNKIEIFNQ